MARSTAFTGRWISDGDSLSLHRELETWVLLFEAARVSIENGTIIEFA
ncbi:hypothetical protein [Nocardia niigatensis]|nr:hypothetical protein [Nocardia niigatensis]